MVEGIRAGNIKLLLCFAFYLAWWVVGFNTIRPIRGLKSGWLLIPAAILGVLALIQIWQGIVFTGGPIPGAAIVVTGAICYVALLVVTNTLLHRPVTSELFIIVLWATIMLLELVSLVAVGSITLELARVLMVFCLVGIGGSLVCYQLFYRLDAKAAFVDGAIPLLLAGILTGLVTWCAR